MIDANAHESAAIQLVDYLRELNSCVVAFSGGVDSSVVAAAAFRALGQHSIAVTGAGPALSLHDEQWAKQVCLEIGIQHEFVVTGEQSDVNYIRNDARRCYYCKSELYRQLTKFAESRGYQLVLSGTNADDLGDYRPGLEAGREHRVLTPLADLGLGKEAVRCIARAWGLSVAERPAAPCLASRIAYGVAADKAALSMIEAAEAYVRSLGFIEFRVRLHADRLARIEMASRDLGRFLTSVDLGKLNQQLIELGFRYVTVDLAGLSSGSMNRVLKRQELPVLTL